MGTGFWQRRLAAFGLGLMLAAGGASAQPSAAISSAGSRLDAELSRHKASLDARQMAMRAAPVNGTNGDAQGLPFAVVDKKNAQLFVFDASGSLRGSTPVLLGSAVGDKYFPGLNQRDLATLSASERTTPAGRFVSEPGRNSSGEAIVWIDYDTALAIHRLRPGPSHERRAQRLASATPADNRISLGCVVTPVAFYESVVAPVLGASRAVIYILPDGPANAPMGTDWLQAP